MLAGRLKLLIVLLPVLLLGRTVSAQDSANPGKIYSRDAKAVPVWVSAESATTSAGEVDWAVLGEQAHQSYLNLSRSTPFLLAKPPGDTSPPEYDPASSGKRPDCVYYGNAFFDSLERPPDKTLEGVLKNSPAILRGRIAAMSPGFFKGEPRTLLVVRIQRVLRTSPQYSKELGTVYLAYPHARFTIGEVTFCKGDTDFTFEPHVGDQVMIFPFQTPQGREGRLIDPRPEELIIEGPNGALALPRSFAKDITLQPESLDSIENGLLKPAK